MSCWHTSSLRTIILTSLSTRRRPSTRRRQRHPENTFGGIRESVAYTKDVWARSRGSQKPHLGEEGRPARKRACFQEGNTARPLITHPCKHHAGLPLLWLSDNPNLFYSYECKGMLQVMLGMRDCITSISIQVQATKNLKNFPKSNHWKCQRVSGRVNQR